jgi:thymidine kinase
MFDERHNRKENAGWIEVISGAMFSGKTEELIRRLKRAEIARQRVAIFKPLVDTRYDPVKLVSHDLRSFPSTPVGRAQDIVPLSQHIDVAGIDEAQFFDDDLPEVCEGLAVSGIRVVIAGLDMDYLGRPFGTMPQLMAIAEYVTKLHAICQQCGNPATHSFRLTDDNDRILVGEKTHYEPRCRRCFVIGMAEKQPIDTEGRLTS